MTEESPAQTSPQSATANPFDLHIHFTGAFVFSIQTESNSSSESAKLTSVHVYAPNCDHMHAATVNDGNAYMLENYWHCIEPDYGAATPAAAITLGQLKTNIAATTPCVPGNRPVGSGWTVAIALPAPPNDWQSNLPVSSVDPASNMPCFGGVDVRLIPSSVATEQVLIYKQVYSTTRFHGACFNPELIPVNGVVDLFITSELPSVIPTRQHQVRAVSSMAGLLGLDLTLQHPLPPGVSGPVTGAFRPMDARKGNCAMGIVSGPGLGSSV
jgi:hypothetical protein